MENKPYTLKDAKDEVISKYKTADDLHELHWSADEAAELYKTKATEELRKENEKLTNIITEALSSSSKANEQIERLTQSNKELVEAFARIIDRIEEQDLQKNFPSAYKRAKAIIQKSEGNIFAIDKCEKGKIEGFNEGIEAVILCFDPVFKIDPKAENIILIIEKLEKCFEEIEKLKKTT